MKVMERLRALHGKLTREKLMAKAKRWERVLLNPRRLLCLGIAWMITNGWSYILFGVGMKLHINWMRIVGGAYMSFLWLPFTPEKLVTVVIALFMLRMLFPRDERSLGVLRAKLARFRGAQ